MNKRRPKTPPPRHRAGFSWTWLGVLLPIAAVVALIIVGRGNDGTSTPTVEAATRAAMFELPATDGSTVALSDALANGDVLLYFSMGVGCDGCFAQIPEVADALAERDITMLPVMVQPMDIVRSTAQSWNIDTPILIDADRSVSKAYGMLGINGHSDRPFHSVVLLRQDGTVALIKNYDTMFVGASDMMADLDRVS